MRSILHLDSIPLRLIPIEYEKLKPNTIVPVLCPELINLIPLLLMLCKEDTLEYEDLRTIVEDLLLLLVINLDLYRIRTLYLLGNDMHSFLEDKVL